MDTSKMVFCFGSNEGGIHGGGAARFAYKERGARWGLSYGHFGQSFAIPTKGVKLYPITPTSAGGLGVGDTLSLEQIKDYVIGFLAYVRGHPELDFQMTCIGCGLAGLRHEDIAPMFVHCDKVSYPNLWFDNVWMHYFAATGDMRPAGYNIWGTF